MAFKVWQKKGLILSTNTTLYELLSTELNRLKKREFKRNEEVYNQGDFPRSLYLIESGIIGLTHTSEKGHETLFRVFSKGYVFGHRSLLAGETYHARALCLTPAVIYEISEQKFKDIYQKKPEILRALAEILAKELGSSELRMADLQDKSAHHRIVESLVFLKLKHPDYTWTRKEIADFAGSTLESVVRVMSAMQESGLLLKEGRKFHILDCELALKSAPRI